MMQKRNAALWTGGSLALAMLLPLAATAQAQTIATGARHSLALTADGSVLAWGDNRLGQLGQGGTPQGHTDQVIPLPSRAVAVKASATNALVLDEQGNVWSWGTNRKGQLGDGSLADRAAPQIVFRNAAQIVFNGGDRYPSTLIDKDGQPWWWGPLPSGAVLATPQQATTIPGRLVSLAQAGSTSAGLDEQGVLWTWGEGAACAPVGTASGPVAMPGVRPIRRFMLTDETSVNMSGRSAAHSLIRAQDRDGRFWKWGSEFVTGGFEGYWPEWKAFCPPAPSAEAQPMLDATYTGPDELRQAGVVLSQVADSGMRATTATQQSFHLGWTADGDLWLWNSARSDSNASVVRKHATDVIDAAPYSGVLDATGSYDRRVYQPGLMYITRDGVLHAVGSNASLHLATGWGDSIDPVASPQQVRLPAQAASVHAQDHLSYALLRDGRVFRWGFKPAAYDAQAAISWPVVPAGLSQLDTAVPLTRLAVTDGTWIGLDADGNVWSAPAEAAGAGSSPAPQSPAMVTRSTGMPAARGITAQGLIRGVDGTLWHRGALARLPAAGQAPGDTGAAAMGFIPVPVTGAPPDTVQVASTLNGSIFALDAAGRVWHRGYNQYGLGEPGGALYVSTPVALSFPRKAVSIHTGDFNICAVLDDGSAFCRGRMFNQAEGRHFRLHAPIRELSISADNAGRGTVILRLEGGAVWAWGKGQWGQLGSGTYVDAAHPVPVVDQSGMSWLDLDPSTPDATAPSGPPFRVKARLAGNLRSLSLSSEVFGSVGTPADAKVYALAAFAAGGSGTAWAQLDAQGQWAPLRWPVPAIASGVQLGSQAQSVPLSRLLQHFAGSGLEGLRLYIGYGRDVGEMLAAGRFREVLEVAPEVLPSN